MALPPHLRLFGLQLLPILVFLAVDALVADPLWAIGAALALVLGQTVVIYARERRLDPFVIFDALLIGGLGAVSLLSKDELFFKLKPAIMEAVIVPFFLALALGGERLIRGYFGRFLGRGMSLNPQALPLLRRMLGVISVLVLAHAGLVVWAALHASRQTWGWISGPGFYLVLVPVVLWALYKRARRGKEPSQEEPRPRVSGRRSRRR